jgi:hypothetical protein
MKGGESVKGEYDGKSLTGKGILWRGGGSILRGGYIFLWEIFCGDLWCEEFGFGGFW